MPFTLSFNNRSLEKKQTSNINNNNKTMTKTNNKDVVLLLPLLMVQVSDSSKCESPPIPLPGPYACARVPPAPSKELPSPWPNAAKLISMSDRVLPVSLRNRSGVYSDHVYRGAEEENTILTTCAKLYFEI